MSGIFGIVQRDGCTVSPEAVLAMRRAMAAWGRDGVGIWSEGCAALGQARTFTTPEDYFESLPIFDSMRAFAFTAVGRLDNSADLVASEERGEKILARPMLPAGHLMLAAYSRWATGAPKRLRGDWAIAAWHPRDRRLFLARDHFGKAGLYYYVDPHLFAFSSSRQALVALGVGRELDELYLAQALTSMTAHHGERTPDALIRRLPPAHCLTLTPDRLETQIYWRMEDVWELRLQDSAEYVEAFREVFDKAVRVRLRADRPTAAMLSGGLDSGSVAATAAEMLGREGKRLRALTIVPETDISAYTGEHLGNELHLARATADFARTIDLVTTPARGLSPISTIRRALAIHGDPAVPYGDGRAFAVLRDLGHRVVLGGRLGNYTSSWPGDILSQPLSYQLRTLGPNRWIRAQLGRRLPKRFLARRGRSRIKPDWYRWRSPILASFADRMKLTERRLADPEELPSRSPLEHRLRLLMPGRLINGSVIAQLDAELGVDIRDPTVDVGLIAFSLSLPDRIFIDPKSGFDRWLIREAMKGRLPDTVRLNRRRGWGVPVMVPRLREHPSEVEHILMELGEGAAASYVDVPHMWEAWKIVQTADTPQAFDKAYLLVKGIAAGLFVNDWFN